MQLNPKACRAGWQRHCQSVAVQFLQMSGAWAQAQLQGMLATTVKLSRRQQWPPASSVWRLHAGRITTDAQPALGSWPGVT